MKRPLFLLLVITLVIAGAVSVSYKRLSALLDARFAGEGRPDYKYQPALGPAQPLARPQLPAEEYKTSAAGDEIEGEAFRLRLLPATKAIEPGQRAKMQVELEAKAPWHVNLEYPV